MKLILFKNFKMLKSNIIIWNYLPYIYFNLHEIPLLIRRHPQQLTDKIIIPCAGGKKRKYPARCWFQATIQL